MKLRLLEDSFFFTQDYGNRRSLYEYITHYPSVYDGEYYDGVYNLSFRGINTSETSGRNPFSVVTDGFVSEDRYRTPRHVYLLPYIAYQSADQSVGELQPGAVGLVSLTSTVPQLKRDAEVVLSGDELEQKLLLRLTGSFSKQWLYGLSANATNAPGEYTNASTLENAPSGKLDKGNSLYLNTYLINDYSADGEIRYFLNLSSERRGYLKGEVVKIEDFDKDHSVKEINKNHYTDFPSEAQDNTYVIGMDGLFYDRQRTNLAHNYGMTLEYYTQKNTKDLDNSDRTIPDINLHASGKDNYSGMALNLNYHISPLEASLSSRYEAAVQLKLGQESAPDILRTLSFEPSGPAMVLDRGDVDFDYEYKKLLAHLNITGSFRYYASLRSYFDFVLNARLYAEQLKQTSEIKTRQDGIFYFNALNTRLQQAGIASYSQGEHRYKANYSDGALLPGVSWTYQHRLSLLNRNDYYIRFYQGFRPGGINPYVIRDTTRHHANYDSERYDVAETGLNGFYNGGLIDFNLNLYYINMRHLQYASAQDALEVYYGNNQGGTGMGAELSYRQRFLPNFEWYWQATYEHAVYRRFVHQLFSSNSSIQSAPLDYSKKKIINTPEYAAMTYLAYTTISGWYLRGEVQHFGPMYFDYANTLKSDGHTLLGAQIGWESKNFGIAVYGKNLLNQRYTQGALYDPYNDNGQAIEDLCQGGICSAIGTDFRWDNTVIKRYGDGLQVGLSLSYRDGE